MSVRALTLMPLLLVLALVSAACTNSDGTDTASSSSSSQTTGPGSTTSIATEGGSAQDSGTEGSDNSLAANARVEVALVFSYHEPYLAPIDGALELASPRLSAARNYLDVPQLLEEFPDASASVAISAPTIAQLESLVNQRGAQRTVDRHYLVANKPPDQLTPDERQFILNNFFEGPPEAFETYQRWDELRERRDAGSTLTDAELGDTAVFFHLAQLDPELVATNERLSAVSQKTSTFTLEDARLVLQAIDNQVDAIGGTYSTLYESERLEIITSTGALPNPDPIRTKDDVTAALGVAADFVGQAPRGITLTADVATDADLAAIAAGGAQWILAIAPDGQALEALPQIAPGSGAPVARQSVPGGSLEIVTADPTLARIISDEYSDLSAAEATEDFIERLGSIADAQGAGEAPLVTVVIDAANVFKTFENEGSTFLRTLINALSTSEDILMTTPTRYITEHASSIGPIPNITSVFSTETESWEGEPEEDIAQALITNTRIALDDSEGDDEVEPEAREAAAKLIRNAEAADFMFYFGQDHDSGHDQIYDRGFRGWLQAAYLALGLEVPEEILAPIVPPDLVAPVSVANGEVPITVDGNPSDWVGATVFDFADTNDVVSEFGIAVDGDSLALRFDGGIESEVQIYLSIPRNIADRITTISGDALGFGATHMVIWTDTEGACLAELLPPDAQVGTLPAGCVLLPSGLSEAGVELKIPSELLGGITAGDVVSVRIKTGSSLGPIAGPIRAEIPADSP